MSAAPLSLFLSVSSPLTPTTTVTIGGSKLHRKMSDERRPSRSHDQRPTAVAAAEEPHTQGGSFFGRFRPFPMPDPCDL
uniref:Uncharacterized protein n=1 Tax=Manihot esculenta TaxID=3983 RepID=A0A2C9V1P5_MANES